MTARNCFLEVCCMFSNAPEEGRELTCDGAWELRRCAGRGTANDERLAYRVRQLFAAMLDRRPGSQHAMGVTYDPLLAKQFANPEDARTEILKLGLGPDWPPAEHYVQPYLPAISSSTPAFQEVVVCGQSSLRCFSWVMRPGPLRAARASTTR
jgi:hypothetical protein